MNNPRWLLFGFCIALLPFIGRPWFFDDSSVVTTAEAAREHPLDPYNYRLDLAYPDTVNWPPGGLPAYTHPPLSAWVLAPLSQAKKEWPLHVVMFSFALAGLWGVSRLSRFFTDHPERAVVMIAFSPAFFLTSLTLYPHLVYFPFAIAALYFTLKIAQRGTWGDTFLLGIMLLLATLSLDSWPLLLVLCALLSFYPEKGDPRRWIKGAVALLVFVGLYGAWCAWEWHLYGMPHILAAFKVRSGMGNAYAWSAAILPLTFIAGAAPFMVLAWFDLRQSSRMVWGLLLAAGPALALYFHSPRGGFSGFQSVLLAGLFSTGLAFVAALLLRWPRASRTERFLSVWFLIEVVFVQKYLVYPSGHHLLMLLVPAALLTIQMAERTSLPTKTLQGGWILMVAFTIFLAHADAGEAKVGPWIAQQAERGKAGNYYWGNCFSGFTHYLNRSGWRAYDVRTPPHPGDRILIPQNLNTQGSPMLLKRWRSRTVAVYPYSQRNPFRTYSLADSAGWYSASWGALPYSLSTKPVESFILLEFQ